MRDNFAAVQKCGCKKPHKNGSYVVRFVHAHNNREWSCRVCPHFATEAEATADLEKRRDLRAFVSQDTSYGRTPLKYVGSGTPNWSPKTRLTVKQILAPLYLVK